MDRESSSQQQDQQHAPEVIQVAAHHQQPPPQPQKCPRCDSSNTKFCYYNNYSLSQPRYFCKSCRRYWTHGGTLRNVPIGGGSRKSKRSKTTSSSSSHEINARTETLSPAPLPSQNLTAGMISGQPLRPLPPVGNSIYTGGAFLPSLAATAAVNFRYGANMTLLQGRSLPSLRPHEMAPPPPHQNEFFQSSLVPPRLSSSWTQSLFYSGGGATSSAADERDQPGSSSFDPDEWSDHNLPGFHHPPQ
ncbi:hypothetical protein CDL12_26174 [Handroanthus impetiginosus]|uniref:Dof zinc finger protein n=1 Tax=Handroanthus impetiginosus TaxID=429701 RepID=A0A2G9G7Q5_9LAMI|nr:hypothetical protein CDL12_26174 [Handroanthus impetiginosus]